MLINIIIKIDDQSMIIWNVIIPASVCDCILCPINRISAQFIKLKKCICKNLQNINNKIRFDWKQDYFS